MIGVLGGSFDPIHFGHINPLNELSELIKFSEIRLIPTYISPVNKSFHANENHRYNMVSIISSSGENNFVADKSEIIKKGISYSYETIKNIKKERNNEDICLIMGLDVFLNIESWYNYEGIIKDVSIIVINRPNFDTKSIESMSSEILDKTTSDFKLFMSNKEKNIFIYETASYNISSTDIRNAISKKESVKGKIPGSIMSYIKRNKLYLEDYE
jgi:nicotinate-nucleotide adenylyltransferase